MKSSSVGHASGGAGSPIWLEMLELQRSLAKVSHPTSDLIDNPP